MTSALCVRRHGLRRRCGPAAAAALAALALWTGVASAQTRTITGRVTEAGSGAAIANVQIAVKGTGIGTISREDGTFTLAVPAEGVTLALRRIGYPRTEVAVPVDQSTVAVELGKDVLKLDEIVVTGQSTGISRRNLANSVATVSSAELTQVPAITIEHAMQGKIAGAQIQQNTGAPGGGNRVRLRGVSSILGNTQPLYVVDGVIASDVGVPPATNRVTRAGGTTAITVASQENPVNRIADINPDDIENVEVLKGAAASAIYGSKASGGVILITTKRGRGGRPAFALRTGVGTARLSYKEGSRRFETLGDAMQAFGERTPAFWAGAWTPENNFDYEELLLGGKPFSHEAALSVSGGSENTRYFVSGLVKRDEGIVKNTFADKKSLRLNLDQTFRPRLTASLSAEVVRSTGDRGLFGNDNSGNSIYYTITKLPSFYDFRPTRGEDGKVVYPVNPFYPSNPFQTIDLLQNHEGVWRTISTAKLEWGALTRRMHELRLVATGGADVFTQRNFVFSPPELQYEQTRTGLVGTSVVSFAQNLQYNVNLNAVHVFTPRESFSLTSQLGTQHEVRDFDVTRAVAQNLQGGLSVITAGTVRDQEEQRLRVEDFGIFAQTEALFHDRFLVTAGLRADRSSNNGDVAKLYVFPKASASYRMPELWRGTIDELKLRVAYGESGSQPQYGQKFTNLTSGSIGGQGGFELGTTRGAADIRPERQRELEGGIDASLFGSRAQLELTGFQRNISDLLIQRTLAPTTGFTNEVYNGASMRVRGFEAVLNAFPLQSRSLDLTWNSRVNFALNRSLITRLPVPPFVFSTPQVGAIRIEQGKSATQLVGNDTVAVAGTCPPRPVDPTICANTRVGDVIPVYMGDGNPDYTIGLGNELRWKGLSLYALFDHQKGGMLAAGTWRHYDLGQNSRDYDAGGPDGKKLGKHRTDTYLKVTRVYYQDVTYWKLRELTLGYDIPKRFVQRYFGGAGYAQVTLSGRNLKWWSKFRGGDPDFSNFGGTPEALQRNRELGAYPASRQFWLNLNLGF